MKTLPLLLVIMLFGITIVSGCVNNSPEASITAPDDQGSTTPNFNLKSLDGPTISLSALRGQPVLLNFWATWCPPCRSEMPHIQELYEDPEWQARDLVILAVDIQESEATAREFMTSNGYSFTVLLDTTGEVAGSYNVRGIPTTVIIDKDGIIRNERVGAFTSKAQIEQFISNSIAED